MCIIRNEYFEKFSNVYLLFAFIETDCTKSSLKLISSKLEFLIDKIFVMFGGRVFLTTCRHSCWCKLCPPSRLAPLFALGRLHTGAYQDKRKRN